MPDPDANRGSVKVAGGTGHVHDERLRQRFADFCAEHPHLTTAVLARDNHTGLSRTMLDGYLRGTYFISGGPEGKPVNPKKSKLEPTLREYLNRQEGVGTHGVETGFVKTVLSSQLEYACDTAVNENIIVVAYGSPGHGKSFSLGKYILNKTTTPPISILCSRNITVGYFVRRLATELRLKNLRCIPETEDRIAEYLIKHKRTLFIDQANYLDERGLGTICHIWERARVGIVLSGTHALHTLFSTLTDKEDIKAQLSSRVALFVPLQGLSLTEVIAVVKKVIGRHANSELTARVFNAISTTHRNDKLETVRVASFRNLSFLLPRLKSLLDKNQAEIDAGRAKPEDFVIMAAGKLMLESGVGGRNAV